MLFIIESSKEEKGDISSHPCCNIGCNSIVDLYQIKSILINPLILLIHNPHLWWK